MLRTHSVRNNKIKLSNRIIHFFVRGTFVSCIIYVYVHITHYTMRIRPVELNIAEREEVMYAGNNN